MAQRDGSMHEHSDGTLELVAESRYLVRFGEGADPRVLRGALTVLRGGGEGVLQFGNYIGEAALGGRRLVVDSGRLTAGAVQRMLDDVAGELASLPFAAATPASAPYARDRTMAPDALYHAYAFLRDGMQARGGHDLPGAVQRILARPHESLRLEEARLIPLGQASQIDAATLAVIHSEPELLNRLVDGSPLTNHPLARRLNGRMPELIRTPPLGHTTDNRENRFVVAALEAMTDISRRFERFVRASGRTSSALNAREAAAIASTLERWRRHPALEPLRAARGIPLESTVLRGRAGYREILRYYSELLARTRLAEPHEMRTLLELRDAAEIYEYWCYFRVVAAVTDVLHTPAKVDRFAVNPLGTRLPYGYLATSRGAQVLYNMTYSRPRSGTAEMGQSSYSVRLRPDITVRGADGRLHLFDAKLKVDFGRAVDADDNDDMEARSDTFKREDLYKMHAYRDALGADSVWVLYPGSRPTPNHYRVPWGESGAPGSRGFRGVGAIALRPSAEHDGGLRKRIAKIVGVPAAEASASGRSIPPDATPPR
ncbi:MAG: DUF2357 domain-containing protein [Actinomycetota bacterium]|nr:DUF2357 domain-containing protein [Actinomycetota bacterium]